MDPQLLRGKEKRALVSSASLGPQYLSTRLVLAGTPPLGTARDKSATTVILPSVEHTAKKCILLMKIQCKSTCFHSKIRMFLQMNSVVVNGQVFTVELRTSEVSPSRTRISKVPENPFRVMSCDTHAALLLISTHKS